MLLPCLLLIVSSQAVPLGGDYWQGTEVKAGEVWGVADLHAHFFNYLGFGGRVLHGTPSAPNGIRQALRNCRSNHGEDRGMSTALLAEPSHPTSGYPEFEGWPRYDTLIHQQAYVDWIRRAWQGGLRLVQVDVQNTPFLGSMYAATNRHFVKGKLTPVDLDDASALELQVGAARLFFNDGPASDFAAIAYSAADARRIIKSGKMAIVLGQNPRETVQRGFIVDVEHMSERAVDETLALAVKAKVPVISSHADFRDLSFGTRVTFTDGGYTSEVNPLPFNEQSAESYGTSDSLKVRTERSRTPQQLALIRKLGGVIAVQRRRADG